MDKIDKFEELEITMRGTLTIKGGMAAFVPDKQQETQLSEKYPPAVAVPWYEGKPNTYRLQLLEEHVERLGGFDHTQHEHRRFITTVFKAFDIAPSYYVRLEWPKRLALMLRILALRGGEHEQRLMNAKTWAHTVEAEVEAPPHPHTQHYATADLTKMLDPKKE